MANYSFPITRSTLRAVPEEATHWLDAIRRAVYNKEVNPSKQAERLNIGTSTFSAFLAGDKLLSEDSLRRLLTYLGVTELSLDTPFCGKSTCTRMIGYFIAGPVEKDRVCVATELPKGQALKPSELLSPESKSQPSAPKTSKIKPPSRSTEREAAIVRLDAMLRSELISDEDVISVATAAAKSLEEAAKARVAKAFKF